jgi:hypothetical protein
VAVYSVDPQVGPSTGGTNITIQVRFLVTGCGFIPSKASPGRSQSVLQPAISCRDASQPGCKAQSCQHSIFEYKWAT